MAARGQFDVPIVKDIVGRSLGAGEIVIDEAILDLGGRPSTTGRQAAVSDHAGPGTARAESGPSSGETPAGARGLDARCTAGRVPEPPAEDGADRPLTLFPAMLEGPLTASRAGSASGASQTSVSTISIVGPGAHRSVDDAPYGGGAGMVMRPEPVAAAHDALRGQGSTAILLDPAGEVFRQARTADLARREHLILLCRALRGVDDPSAASSISSCPSAITS
jgi:hypothetical protein